VQPGASGPVAQSSVGSIAEDGILKRRVGIELCVGVFAELPPQPASRTPAKRTTTTEERRIGSKPLPKDVRGQIGGEARVQVIAADRDVARQHENDDHQQADQGQDQARCEGSGPARLSNFRPRKGRVGRRWALPAAIGKGHELDCPTTRAEVSTIAVGSHPNHDLRFAHTVRRSAA